MEEYLTLLREQGDYAEQMGMRLGMGQPFPNYAEFWAKYIYPLRAKGGIALREDLPVEIERVCMTHYSVWYHLCKARIHVQRNFIGFIIEPIPIEDAFYHLVSSIDMVNELMTRLIIIRHRLTGRGVPTGLTQEKVVEKCEKFYQAPYSDPDTSREARKFAKKLLKADDELKSLDTARSDLEKVACKIRLYRNAFTHDPVLGRIVKGDDGTVLIPREPDLLGEYDTWSKVRHGKQDDFQPATEIIETMSAELEVSTNSLWPHLISTMEEIVAANGEYSALYAASAKTATASPPDEVGVTSSATATTITIAIARGSPPNER